MHSRIAACLLAATAGAFVSTYASGATRPSAPASLCVNSTCVAATGSVALRARSAAAFVDSIGVNVHFSNPGTVYVTKFSMVKEKLLSLGITHLRDGAVDRNGGFSDDDRASLFRELGAAGARVTFIFNANTSKEFVQGFPARVGAAFEAFEFPNELNAAGIPDWAGTLRAWAPVFSSHIRSSKTTAAFPIIAPSLADKGDNPAAAVGDLSAYVDFGNTHAYYTARHPATPGWGGAGPPPCAASRYGSLTYNLCNARRVSATKPVMSTETGWGSDVTVQGQVTPALQAKYLARMLLDHFDADVARTFIYQLVETGNDGFKAYGLVKETGEEKPAFTELKALIGLLRDKPTNASAALTLTLTGDKSDVRTMLFQKSDGSFRLVLWIEKQGFDPFTRMPVAVPPVAVKLRLGDSARVRASSAFQDDGRIRADAPSADAAGQYSLTLTDNLTVLDIAR